MARSIVGMVVLLGLSSPVMAQDKKGDVAFSYSVMRDQDLEETFPVGWVVAGAFNLNQWLGVVGEIGGNYKTLDTGLVDIDLSVHTFLGGARFGGRGSTSINPFGQVLVGLGRASGGAAGVSASDTGVVIQPGVGLDFSLTNRLGVRVQGDYRAIRNDGETTNEFRFAGGVVFVF